MSLSEAPKEIAGHGLLEGKVVVVTAAAGTGIGAATARRALAEGADVLVSDKSATDGFTPLTSVTLKSGADRQHFALAKPGTGRWIKLVIKNNHGDPDYTELMEFRALGRQLTQTPLPANLSGTYAATAFGKFHLQQDGAALTGCSEYAGGLVQGDAGPILGKDRRLQGPQAGGVGCCDLSVDECFADASAAVAVADIE